MAQFTADKFLNPGIRISQPEKGYRYSIDPFILASHVITSANEKIIDIGCGCAIIPLLLALKSPDLKVGLKITGIEIQKELYLHAKKNIMTNKFENTINIIHRDIHQTEIDDVGGKADIIVSNPPYKKRGSGRLNPDSQKAIARHEIKLDIDMLLHNSGRLLKEKGKLYIIFPAPRLPDLILTMEQNNFAPEFIRFVHVKKKSMAKLLIVCAVKNYNNPCKVLSPFYIYERGDQFSKEYLDLFQGCIGSYEQ